MPTIDVTMGDGVVDVSVGFAGSYTDDDARAAVDDATITPAQVGTAAAPVAEEHVESSHLGELSVTHDGSPAITREVVYAAEDTDNTTPLSFDTGALGSTYQRFLLRGHVGGHGTGSISTLQITVNGHTSGYLYRYIGDGGATGTTSGTNAWKTEMWDQWHTTIDFEIFGNDGVANSSRGPLISGSNMAHPITDTLLHGILNEGGQLPVSSVQASTPFNAVGKLVVIGVSY